MTLEGEIAGVCDADQVLADMQKAKENDGVVYLYKRKKEIKAICFFDVEERDIPLNAAVVKKEEVMADLLKEDKNRVVEETGEETNTVRKNCFVLKGFYVVPSYEEYREELKKLFCNVIKGRMTESGDKIPAYIWEDEIVMSNQIISSDGKMVSAVSIGACMGAAIGVLLCLILGYDNIGMGLLWGVVIGGLLTTGTTTIKSKIMFVK